MTAVLEIVQKQMVSEKQKRGQKKKTEAIKGELIGSIPFLPALSKRA